MKLVQVAITKESDNTIINIVINRKSYLFKTIPLSYGDKIEYIDCCQWFSKPLKHQAFKIIKDIDSKELPNVFICLKKLGSIYNPFIKVDDSYEYYSEPVGLAFYNELRTLF